MCVYTCGVSPPGMLEGAVRSRKERRARRARVATAGRRACWSHSATTARDSAEKSTWAEGRGAKWGGVRGGWDGERGVGSKEYLACEDALVGRQQGEAVETRQQVDAHPRVLRHTQASVVARKASVSAQLQRHPTPAVSLRVHSTSSAVALARDVPAGR